MMRYDTIRSDVTVKSKPSSLSIGPYATTGKDLRLYKTDTCCPSTDL